MDIQAFLGACHILSLGHSRTREMRVSLSQERFPFQAGRSCDRKLYSSQGSGRAWSGPSCVLCRM